MSAAVELTGSKWAELSLINSAVNRLPYKDDVDLYHQEDFWERITTKGGDCEDYALEKRVRLLKKGWPLEALRLTVCLDETGVGHAVLAVDTSKGTMVLDNRHDRPMPWDSLPYYWIMQQEGQGWVNVESNNG